MPAEPTTFATPECCDPPDPRIARQFDERAEEWTDTDEFPLLVDVSGRLVDYLHDATLLRPTVLELGCGTGAVSVALLEDGARSVTGIDLSATSIAVARRRAADAGFAGEATFEVGDAAAVSLARHDWVILDRVICCFGAADRLIAHAIGAAASRIAISGPESRGWRGPINQVLWSSENLWDRLHGGCTGYVHSLRRIESTLAQAGFEPMPGRSGHIGLWFIGVYEQS